MHKRALRQKYTRVDEKKIETNNVNIYGIREYFKCDN